MVEKGLSDVSTETLKKELETRENAGKQPPKPLERPDFTELRKTVIEGIEEAVREQYEDEDFEHYVYEAAMEAVYGKGFWDWRNKQEW